jgi:hypothetical protein
MTTIVLIALPAVSGLAWTFFRRWRYRRAERARLRRIRVQVSEWLAADEEDESAAEPRSSPDSAGHHRDRSA